jgi:hypothetical protein
MPGSTFTGMTARGRTEKSPGSWTPDQVIDILMRGDRHPSTLRSECARLSVSTFTPALVIL